MDNSDFKDFLLRMLEIVLKYNIFEFNKDLYIQLIGTAMGSRPAPSYANIFMANKIDQKISELATRINNGENPLLFFKRFLDDIFLVYTGCLKKLHLFLSELNNIHPSIKFTMTHTTPSGVTNPDCGCKPSESLAFLDTSCTVQNGKIVTDLYRKQLTEINMY